jgi:class III poly(R)-hydroxyalkanoic acid synthase PhaE subunit
MANNPFGPFGPFAPGAGGASSGADFEQLARQYWGAWGDALRAAAAQPAVPQGVPHWQQWHDVVDWWSKLAHGGRSEANDVVDRFNAQARHWFGQMQQVAAQFAGQDHSASQIADAWKKALGASGENPFPEIFRAMRGHGQHGLDQWIEDASPYLEAWRREAGGWLSMPAFGIGREHQERLQKLAQAQLDYQEKSSAYNALMAKAAQEAFELFEGKLAEREEPGRQLTSARALFDLWIDAAEEAYADIALSQEFREVYGALVNAQMRLRGGIQKEVELTCGLFGMPTRTEVDAAHRKIAELERQLHRTRAAAAPARPATPSGGNGPEPKKPARKRSARKTTAAAAKPAPRRTPSKSKAKPAKRVTKNKRASPAVAGKPRKAAPVSLLGHIAMPQQPDAAVQTIDRHVEDARA